MNRFDMINADRRARQQNEANHFNGRSGYHASTNTRYQDGKPVYTASPYTDRYNYRKS